MSRCSNMRVQKPELFDHFVGPLLELHGHIEAKRLGGLEIDHELTTSAVAGPSAAGRRGPSSAGASLSRSELQPSWTSGCISTATPVRHRSSPTWRQRSVSHPRSSRRGLFCVERQASYVRIRGAASVLRDLVLRYQS